ncbi:MAG: GNAT family N-acetyltransferase [Candidatus Eremiobacteraeota bacterium]|nr:GNAT family N-acetyltransferase [Candidatus Eremiobacteraeota bacterium]
MNDVDAILTLNRESEALLSPLDPDSTQALIDTAYCAWVTPERDAMLIALNEKSTYASPNFKWFSQRYERFIYVDRVVVAESARGRGLARALYERLIGQARADGYPVVCAEIYYDPPNPASDAFHESMGFVEIGRAYLDDRGKSVRYIVRSLEAQPPES